MLGNRLPMAEVSGKHPLNAAGPYYIDDQCSECASCLGVAPNHIQRDPDSGQSYFAKQPQNDAERIVCQEALESCPVEAIGNDG